MQFAPGVDRRIGHADFLDFFEVEEPLAVEEGVESHDAHGRVEDGEGEGHGVPRWWEERAIENLGRRKGGRRIS